MKKEKKILSFIFLAVFVSALFFISDNALGAEIKVEKVKKTPIIFTPQITIPGSEIFKKGVPFTITKETLPTMARDLYRFLVGSAGIVAVIVMMAGGYYWLFAGGNTARVGQAKDYIGGAVVGLTLSLGSFMILNMINPDLINMKDFEIPAVPKVSVKGIPVAGGLTFPGLKCVWSPNYPNDGGYIGVSEKNEKYFCGVRPADFEIPIPNKTESIQQPPVCFCKIQPVTSECMAISGDCSPDKLKSNFDERITAEMASRICKIESGGEKNSESGTDLCYNAAGKKTPFSIGLFQINLRMHKLSNIDCPSAFNKISLTQSAIEWFKSWFGVTPSYCKVVDEILYNQCVAEAKKADINIAKAVSLSQEGIHWHDWGTYGETKWGSNIKCGFPP